MRLFSVRAAGGVLVIVALAAGCTARQGLGERPESEVDPAAGDPRNTDAGNTEADNPSQPRPDGASSETAKDTTPPNVVLTANPTTITASGNINLNVGVSDASGIARVVVYSGTGAISTFAGPPYSSSLPVTQADNGIYVFTAEATDSAGNVGTSAPVTVKVDIAGPPPLAIPSFVAAGAATLITGGTSLALSTPNGIQADDFLLALIDAEEETSPRTLVPPVGWTLVGGFPIHNVSTAHPPYIIPASENHGTWIFHKFATADEPTTTSFQFPMATTARGVIVSYRGVDTSAPIHDKSALAFHGTGGTNGLGSGNTSLQRGRQVNLIATARTSHATYTVVSSSPSIAERFNSGEQPNGLNLIVYDATISFGFFLGPSITNKQSPSGLTDGFLFSATTLVLKPK